MFITVFKKWVKTYKIIREESSIFKFDFNGNWDIFRLIYWNIFGTKYWLCLIFIHIWGLCSSFRRCSLNSWTCSKAWIFHRSSRSLPLKEIDLWIIIINLYKYLLTETQKQCVHRHAVNVKEQRGNQIGGDHNDYHRHHSEVQAGVVHERNQIGSEEYVRHCAHSCGH